MLQKMPPKQFWLELQVFLPFNETTSVFCPFFFGAGFFIWSGIQGRSKLSVFFHCKNSKGEFSLQCRRKFGKFSASHTPCSAYMSRQICGVGKCPRYRYTCIYKIRFQQLTGSKTGNILLPSLFSEKLMIYRQTEHKSFSYKRLL